MLKRDGQFVPTQGVESEMEEKVEGSCPSCGKDTLVRRVLPDGKYVIVCSACGLERGRLPPDDKKGVV